MKHILSEHTLLKLSDFISSGLGLHFPKERWNDLERKLVPAANNCGFNDIEQFALHLISAQQHSQSLEVLAAHVTINETFFWREPETFEALMQKILPELVSLRQKEKCIRIWSAGCSSGEEPYSIAIALSRVIPNISSWNITILATDVNLHVLRKAAEGEYSHWSFRNAPKWLRENYCVQREKNKYSVIPAIRDMVKFEYLNLAEDVFPSPLNNTNAMDIVFCRNVLMYFTNDCSGKVTNRLYNALQHGGYLIVSASELSVQNFSEFTHINLPGAVVFRKPFTKNKRQNKVPVMESPREELSFQLPVSPNSIYHPITLPPDKIEEKVTDTYELLPSLSSPVENSTVILDEVLKEDRTTEQHIIEIRDLANRGKLNEAKAACEEAIATYKLDPRLYYLQAIILQENNQLSEAIVSLKRAMYIDSNFVLSYYALGNIYKQLGKTKSAQKNYKIVLSLLSKCKVEDILPESEGLTAGRFKEILSASIQAGANYDGN